MSRAVMLSAALAGMTVLAVGAAAVAVLLRGGSTPATVADAVTRFRDEPGSARSQAAPVPPGVYLYATDGFERTDALTGVEHVYPERSTVTITRAPCGFRMRWDVLEGRSTTWVVCVDSRGWTLASQDERHTFFGRTERTTYRCEGATLRTAEEAAGRTSELTCSTGESDERGTVEIAGRETQLVDGSAVETVRVRTTTELVGATRGSSRRDFWFAVAPGVPVRITMETRTANRSPIGDVRYEEQVALGLLSLEPHR